VKLVFSIHSTLSREIAGERCLKVKVFPALIRLFYRFADEIIAVSQGVADDLYAYGGIEKSKIKVILNPVITPDLLKMAKEPIGIELPIKEGSRVVIGVGRLNRLKDFPTLIRAVKLVRQTHEAELVILGEGEERAALEALIEEYELKEHVRLVGFVDNPYAIMAKASVFVLSSISEGLPTVLIEALALGLPVVSTDCESGPREILEGAGAGKLVRVGDVDAMARAIIAVFEGNSTGPAKQADLEPYTVDSAVNRYLELLG
jgi:glycosyltransferase involved in cell wall biosynthesis